MAVVAGDIGEEEADTAGQEGVAVVTVATRAGTITTIITTETGIMAAATGGIRHGAMQ